MFLIFLLFFEFIHLIKNPKTKPKQPTHLQQT